MTDVVKLWDTKKLSQSKMKFMSSASSIRCEIAAISDRTGMTGDKIGFQNIGIFCEQTNDNDKNSKTLASLEIA